MSDNTRHSPLATRHSSRWHFIGLGGAGMSVLAHALLDQGAVVSGSDLQDTAALDGLRARGVRVTIGQGADNPDLQHATRVVVTAAVPATNPELLAARAAGLPIITRAALLGELMAGRRGVAVAGTHGKTTTTAMIAWILREAGRDPAFLVGGVLHDLRTGGHWGAGPELVVEADEYDRSFHHLHPQVAVITNIEAEHLDIYGDYAGVQAAFRQFAEGLQPGGTLLCCGDDPGAATLARELGERWRERDYAVALYGTRAEYAWRAEEGAHAAGGGSHFTVYQRGTPVAELMLLLSGAHNVLNGLAAIAAAHVVGVGPEVAAAALGRFHGTERRFEVKGEREGVLVIDDYAHHPTEIVATLAAARRYAPARRLVAAFQPHTYSRTRAFLPQFATALAAADVVVVTEIYAAREADPGDVQGADIVRLIEEHLPGRAHFAPDLAATEAMLRTLLRPGDLLLTLGAGDIWTVGERVLSFEF